MRILPLHSFRKGNYSDFYNLRLWIASRLCSHEMLFIDFIHAALLYRLKIYLLTWNSFYSFASEEIKVSKNEFDTQVVPGFGANLLFWTPQMAEKKQIKPYTWRSVA